MTDDNTEYTSNVTHVDFLKRVKLETPPQDHVGTGPQVQPTKLKRDSVWQTPLAVALVGVMLTAFLATIDRSDLRIDTYNFQGHVCLVVPESPYQGKKLYASTVNFELIFSHNQSGEKNIVVSTVEFESQRLASAPGCEVGIGSVPTPDNARYNYLFELESDGVRAFRVDPAGPEQTSIPATNILNGGQIDLPAKADRTSETAEVVIKAAQPGLYRTRFRTTYRVAGDEKSDATNWVFVLMPQPQAAAKQPPTE